MCHLCQLQSVGGLFLYLVCSTKLLFLYIILFYAQQRGYCVPLSVPMSCANMVLSAGRARPLLTWRHHMTACGSQLFSLI